LRGKGILFRADFTEERFIQTVMYPREVDKAVDKLLRDQQMDHDPYSVETLVRAREWFEAMVAGLERMRVLVEGMDYADKVEREEREREERERRQLPLPAVVQVCVRERERGGGGGEGEIVASCYNFIFLFCPVAP
jgi:hypothetical protein